MVYSLEGSVRGSRSSGRSMSRTTPGSSTSSSCSARCRVSDQRARALVAGERGQQPGRSRARSPPDVRARRGTPARRSRRRRATHPRPSTMVDGAIHGMSASATSQPSASAAAATPQARLAPMPSSARAHTTTRAPVSRQHVTQCRIAGPNHGDHVVERGDQVHAGGGPDRRAAAHAVRCRGHRRQQLGAAEARAAASGEKQPD